MYDWQTKSELLIGKDAARKMEDPILLLLTAKTIHKHCAVIVEPVLIQSKSNYRE